MLHTMTTLMTTSISAEEWRTTNSYDTYEVSTHGRVRNKETGVIRVLKLTGKTAYPYVTIRGRNRGIHQLVAETFIPNPADKPCVDHIDGNPLNNHVSNLRWATRTENQYNKRTRATHKGVSWNTRLGKWYAQIKVAETVICLGYFDDQEEAYHVYCAAAVLYHGDFACG